MLFHSHFLLTGALLYQTVLCTDDPGFVYGSDEDRHRYNAGRTVSVGYLVFNGYAPLDLWGPLHILTSLSSDYNMTLAIISSQTGAITSADPPHIMPPEGNNSAPIMTPEGLISSSMIATHTPATAPPLDLLMIPGGFGSWNPGSEVWMEDFLRARFNTTDYIASVCTGSMTLARAGVLNGKRATSNKWGWNYVVQNSGPGGENGNKGDGNVTWVPSARWVHDGKIWTSSGVAAGMDMTYALLSWMYGSEKVNTTMNNNELSPHVDEHWDPYSVVHKVPGADTSRPLKELTGPVGYDEEAPRGSYGFL